MSVRIDHIIWKQMEDKSVSNDFKMAHGYLRYEAIKNMSRAELDALCDETECGEKSFDALVDELIEKGGK